MIYKLERSAQAKRDLASVQRFLVRSYMHFGDDFARAKERSIRRLQGIRLAMNAIATRPKQGTLLPKLMPGLRSVTKDRAVFYFLIDEERCVVRVLAVFFGGQDHQRDMLKRLLSE